MQYLYLLRAGEQYYKVGIAANVRSRVVGLQAHNPARIRIVTAKLLDNAYDIEQATHKALADMKASGANEWFELTPEQALELCSVIHSHPDIDLSERITLKGMLDEQRRLQRIVERKLDYVINTYQKFKPAPPEPQNLAPPNPPAEPTVMLTQPPGDVPALAPRPADVRLDEDVEIALAVVKAQGKASTSLLQRQLSFGYGRAARIMDELERRGHIGPADGARARAVYK